MYLARCVRRWYGAGAADLLREARFRHAARAIAEDGRHITVASIAYATGFSDEAHLSREFSRRAGLPPARYRRLMGELGFGNSSFGGRATVPFAHGQTESDHAASMGVGCSPARLLGDSAARD